MTGPLWLCMCDGCQCYQVASSRDGVEACSDSRCQPVVRYAGYRQDVEDGREKHRRVASGQMLSLAEFPRRARHILEIYAEARVSGSVRKSGIVRVLMANVGSVLERVYGSDSQEIVDSIAIALDGEDRAGLRAALCTAMILMDCGWSREEALRFANDARKIRTGLPW
jgi:hypothetical protein